jgi:hypothetical protein
MSRLLENRSRLGIAPMAFMEIFNKAVYCQDRLVGQERQKRKNATIARPTSNADFVDAEEKGKTSAGESTELRTGRWTLKRRLIATSSLNSL